jgi:competence protein ComEA
MTKLVRVFTIALLGGLLAISAAAQSTSTAKSKSAATSKTTATTSGGVKPALMDINTASVADLATLPGIGKVYSQKIYDGRPYTKKDQLVSRKIIPQATYDTIKDQIIAKKPPAQK